jgi:amino acid adenylation domain-containing protein
MAMQNIPSDNVFVCSPQQRTAWQRLANRGEQACLQVVSAPSELPERELRDRLQEVVGREEALRTTFLTNADGGGLVQCIGASGSAFWLEPAKMDSSEGADLAAQLRDAGLVDREAAFDTRNGPLFRARLLRGARSVRLLLTASPLIADRESLLEICARVTGGVARAASIRFRDYARWRAGLMSSRDNAAERLEWDLAPTALPLGAHAAGPAGKRVFASKVLDLRLRSALMGEESPQRRLAALWALYIARVTGRDRVHLAVRFTGRAAPQLEHAVGPFAQILPVAFNVAADDSVDAFLRRAFAGLRDAAERQDYASLLDFEREEEFCVCDIDAGNEKAEVLWEPPLMGALGCRARLDSSRATLELSGAASRYKARDLSRLLAGFSELVQAASGATAAAVRELPCVGTNEVKLVRELGKSAERADEGDVLERFRAQVARTPNAVAASHGSVELSYAVLDARSNALAAALAADARCQGGHAVPIFMTSSPEWLCVALAVLKTGRAFAPLDPTHPRRRIQAMLQALQAEFALTTTELSPLIDGLCNAIVLRESSAPAPVRDATLDSVAYVMFTSGSTGVPNAVPVTRRGFANYLGWSSKAYDLANRDGALVHTSAAFDLTLTALIGPLTCGGRVVFPEKDSGLGALIDAFKSGQKLGVLKTTPSLLRAFANEAKRSSLTASVETIVVGGEALTGADLVQARAVFGRPRIFNEYGPTETVIGCCVFDATNWTDTGAVPIGKPISGFQLSVRSSAGLELPLGAVGELFIQGPGQATGYLNHEESERFTELQGQPNYRSGDLVRYRSGGHLEFLGRVDDELKLNGIRCRPGEIESAMLRVPGIATAVACLKDDSDGQARLAGYYVRASGSAPVGDAEFRTALAQALLPALIPAVFCEISQVPLTPNGKRDIERLPDPFAAKSSSYESPHDEIEETLVAVLSSVFERPVGLSDNYFALGGDSLHSVRVTALARKRGLDVSVAQLHATPVVRELARAIRSGDPLLDVSPRTRPFDLVDPKDRALMPAEVEDAYPLNLLQEGMIYHREFSPKSAVYHAICSYTVRAKLDVGLMTEVIHDLVARHPLLRSSFDLTGYSRPLQLVHSEFETPLEVVEMPDASESAFNNVVNGWIEHEKATGFELTGYPLIRYCIHRWRDGVFQLSYSFHHEIIDGWSDAFMVTELLRDYFARLNNEPFAPPLPQATFRDSIEQERAALSNDAFKQFWLRELGDAKLMRLPRLNGRFKADKGEREIVKFEVPVSQELSDELKALARKLAVPIKTVLLAAHMRVMAFLGGGKDTMSYTVGNGRPENAAGHGVIGLFVNSLAFRLALPGGTWTDLILSALAKEQSLLPYRRYPMAELKRQAGNEPLSETLFFFNHYHVADVFDGREDASLLGIKVYGESTFPYCINAYIEPVSKRIGMRIEYDSLQFAPGLMATIEQGYIAVLGAMVRAPDARYDTESLLGSNEHMKLCRVWSDPGTPPPAPDVLQLLEKHVRETPDRVAIVHEGRHSSYAWLDRNAARIAAALARHGVRPWSRVALCVERSQHLVPLIIGVLRAGGAYVPVDPALPAARQRAVLEDAQPDLIVADSPLASEVLGTTCIALSTLLEEADGLVPTRRVEMATETPAYLIYTSGTTGASKGVSISRGALAQSTAARLEYYREDVPSFLLLSSYAFDSSVAGIFGTLCQGGAIVLPSGAGALDLSDVAELVGRHAVTQTLTVPSLYAAMLRVVRSSTAGDSLRSVIVAGEALPVDVVNCHVETLPGVALHNEYGPTEATVWATAFTVKGRMESPNVPIGKPIRGVQLYVIDAFEQLAPTGVAGELNLAGVTLAEGYHRRPAETAAAFVPCPFAAQPGQRMYRTGDLVAWGANGDLDFLGRCDRQVKIQGFRIELGDVEAALSSHRQVRACAVQPKPDATGQVRLVAYVVPEPGGELDAQQLAKHMREHLPKYMLPAAYTVLERLPTLASGKLDVQALPAPSSATFERSRPAYRQARNATEEVVVGIWAATLGIEKIGLDDDFHELGGDSLRAMRIVAALQKAFGTPVSVRVVMAEGATPAKVALAVAALLQPSAANERGLGDAEYVRL